MKSGSIFDNILISDDESEAEKMGKETWEAMKVIECSIVNIIEKTLTWVNF